VKRNGLERSAYPYRRLRGAFQYRGLLTIAYVCALINRTSINCQRPKRTLILFEKMGGWHKLRAGRLHAQWHTLEVTMTVFSLPHRRYMISPT
jgi:hypothetical protein